MSLPRFGSVTPPLPLPCANKRNLTKDELLTLIAKVLGNRYLFAKLIALQYTVLEHNVEYSDVLAFKQMMHERLSHTGHILEECSPIIHRGQGFRLLMWMYSMVIGLIQMAEPSPVLQRIYAKERGMSKFQVNFSEEYFPMLGSILDGWATAPAKQLKKARGAQ